MYATRTVLAALCLALVASAAARPASAQQREWCGTYNTNTTWTRAESPHVVRCDVIIESSTLTIEPGVQVFMTEATNLVIGADARLEAVSTEAAGPIQIQHSGPDGARGYWGQIRFEPGALDSAVNRIVLNGGGLDGVPMFEARDTVVTLDNALFRYAADAPLGFSANVIGPSLDAPGRRTQGGACRSVDVSSSNASQAIVVRADQELDVTGSQSWFNFCVPYRVTDVITVAGPDDPVLAIEAGTVMSFDGDAGLVAGHDSENWGQINLNGSASEPVRLTAESGVAGGWNGVDLTEYDIGSSVISTIIEYGGRGGRSMVRVHSDLAVALGISLRNALGHPLEIGADGLGMFLDGVVRDPAGTFIDNGVGRVLVEAGDDIDLRRSDTWGDVGVPYEIDGTLTIAGDTFPELTLTEGTTLVFGPGEALVLGDPDAGTGGLRTREPREGEDPAELAPVVLTGEGGQPGSWIGVHLTDEADLVRLFNATLEYGGEGGVPMLDWQSARGSVAGTTFRGALGYPVAVPADLLTVLMVYDDERQMWLRNRFEGNGTDRVLARASGRLDESLIEWADPGAPVEFEASVTVSGTRLPKVTAVDGLRLLFRPGVTLEFGQDGPTRAALRVDDEDPELPVTFSATDEAAGWGGVIIRENSSVVAADWVVEGAAADAANLALAGGIADLERVTLRDAAGIGLDVGDAVTSTDAPGAFAAHVRESRIEGNRVGVRAHDGGRFYLRRSIVAGNTEWGVLNEDPSLCQVAVLVYWGASAGPHDPSNAVDDCTNGALNTSPQADKTSDFVVWWPYALDASFTPSRGLGPSPRMIYLPTAQLSGR